MADNHLITDHQSATAYAQHMAGPAATTLHRLAEATLGAGARMWLSGATVWAVRPEGDQWAAYTMTDTEAATWAQHAAMPILAALTDPTRHVRAADDRDKALDAWEDFRDLYLSTLGTDDAAETDRAIRDRMEQARRWMAILGMLRASHVRRTFGAERGAQAAAARTLNVHPATISALLSDDERFWSGWHYDVNEILAGRPPRDPFELD